MERHSLDIGCNGQANQGMFPLSLMWGSDKIVVIKEFRVPIGDYCWSFPSGVVDAGESIKEGAYRELKEETGLDISTITHVSKPMLSCPSLTDEEVTFVYVRVKTTSLENLGSQGQGPNEDITPEVIDWKRAEQILESDGKIEIKTALILQGFIDDNKEE